MTPCARAILSPTRLWTPEEVFAKPSPVPPLAGAYGWYFRRPPGETPWDECIAFGECRLLYVGISPAREGSRQNLRRRIRNHLRGNASGSTLRLTLGVLLGKELGLGLRPVGGRLTFGPGEANLSAWMRENALVVWCPTEIPRTVEKELLALVRLPLNLESNATSPFAGRLSALRVAARARCRD